MRTRAPIGVVAVLLVLVVAFLGYLAFSRISGATEIDRQRAIVNDIRPLIEDCRQKGKGDFISVRGEIRGKIGGKFLVWDVKKDSPAGAHKKLPSDLKASSSDSPITAVLVLSVTYTATGQYSRSYKFLGYTEAEACIALWPERKAIGMITFKAIPGFNPDTKYPLVRSVSSRHEFGDIDERIASNLKALPLRAVAVKASIETIDGAKWMKVSLYGQSNDASDYLVRMANHGQHTDWYEEEVVAPMDLADGNEMILLPIHEFSTPNEAKESVSASLEVIERATTKRVYPENWARPTREAIYRESFKPSPQDTQPKPRTLTASDTIATAPLSKVELAGAWPTAMNNSRRSGKSSFAGPERPFLRRFWVTRYEPGPDTEFRGDTFIGSDGTLYLVARRPDTRELGGALDARRPDGSLKWNFRSDRGGLAITNEGTIYVGCQGFYTPHVGVCALDSHGFLKWRWTIDEDRVFFTHGSSNSPAVGSDGTVYITSTGTGLASETTGYLWAIAPNGNLKWKFAVNGYIMDLPAISDDGTIFFIIRDRTGGWSLERVVRQSKDNLYAVSPRET